MTNIEQMRHHLAEMLTMDRRIQRYKDSATGHLVAQAEARSDPALKSPTWHLVLQARLGQYLDDDPWFGDLIADRSFHTTRAALYAAATQAENSRD